MKKNRRMSTWRTWIRRNWRRRSSEAKLLKGFQKRTFGLAAKAYYIAVEIRVFLLGAGHFVWPGLFGCGWILIPLLG